ncbi:hypothetical protein [Isoptericola sp. AK164]|uniref:hypothetical protein n=1 Tax=Isoptericola sp. AK164 TaxID=3024246 RepID=UPI0024187F58|nr:hypothetical protein [Isoptericola sp. AK164]
MAAVRPTARPGSVTVVVVLTWIVAFFSALAGVIMLLASDEVLAEAGISASNAAVYSWTEIAFGVITALVAIGLSNGNRFSRFLVTVLMAVRAALTLWTVISWWGTAGSWSALVSGLFAILVISMLWNARANEFFRST